MTPLYIRMAMCFATSKSPEEMFNKGEWESAAAKEVISHMSVWGLLREDLSVNSGFTGTKKLEFWVGYLCSIPIPIESFIIPEPDD